MRTTSAVAMLALMPALAAGHGYISRPASRAFGCRRGNGQLANANCGAVQFEPQSVEGNDGSPRYPARAGNEIPDGRIASANRPGTWRNLDEQSATRWDKVPMSAGQNTFEWTFTASHSTRDFRYWISRPDWNPNQPLARATFEDTPFCTVSLGNRAASTNPNHQCNVPARRGYAVILGVWDVADTSQSFYNVIDVQFDGTAPTPPTPPVTRPTPPTPPVTRPTPPTPPTPPVTRPTPPTPPVTRPVPGGSCALRGQRCFPNSGGCCSQADACVEGWPNAGWFQCVARSTAPDVPPAPVPVPTTSAPVPGGQCRRRVRNWGPCKGREACCRAGWRCVRQSRWYSQCQPRRN